jgi:uncharacterized protein (TIGR00369 family)
MTKTVPIADFEGRVRRSFARQVVMHTVGAELTRVAPGCVEIELPFSEALTQQHGFLHAGVISTVLDSACGYAALTLMPADTGVLSIEFKVNLLAAAKSGHRFLFRGSITKPGRTIVVTDGQALALAPGAEPRLIATMTGTMMVIANRDGVRD